MSKIKIISEYTYNNFSNSLADLLTDRIERWISENNVNVLSTKIDINNTKNDNDDHLIVMTASIMYE